MNHSALKHQTIHLRAHPAYVLNCCDGIFGFICLKMKGLFNHLKSSPIKLTKLQKLLIQSANKEKLKNSPKSLMKAKSPIKFATDMFCQNGSFLISLVLLGLCILVVPNDKTHIRHCSSYKQKIFNSNQKQCLIALSKNIFPQA